MKHFVTTFFTLAFVLAFTLGCKKSSDDAPAPSNNTTTPTLQKNLDKKWDVSPTPAAAGRVAAGSDDYSSFEFTDEGKYFIIKADKSVLKGDYSLNVGDSIVTLNGLGIIYVDEITETTITFRFVPTGATEPIVVKATPATPVSTSKNTQNLVNSWSFKSRKTNGVSDAAFNDAFNSAGYYLYVTFTTYGTYNLETNIPQTPNTTGYWKWCDTEQTYFGASPSADVEPTCTATNNNVSFDSDGNFVLTSKMPNGNVYEDTYVTKP